MHSLDKNSKGLGQKGEEQAADSLIASGMKIIARNYRAKLPGGIGLGEVDIIALDKETIVFAEVKTWSSFGMENLQYSLDIRKQRKIIKTAKYFMSENREYNNMTIRFDVIFVKENSITHLASAFTESV
ncbi:MAG: YraN family protein [Treponema sp.]|nr:YraN family protein [Treponema sp.]